VSAFAPITNPINCPWGQKAFSNYLGDNKSDWEVNLMRKLHVDFKQVFIFHYNKKWKNAGV